MSNPPQQPSYFYFSDGQTVGNPLPQGHGRPNDNAQPYTYIDNQQQGYEQPQDYGQSQGPTDDRQPGYGQPPDFGQSQGYTYDRQPGYGQPPGYRETQGQVQSSSYGQPKGYGHHQGYGPGDGQGQGLPQSSYRQSQGYGQYQTHGVPVISQDPQPSNYWVLALVACCINLPFGLVSLIFSFLSTSAYYDGRLEEARKKGRVSMFVSISGIVVTCVATVLAIIFKIVTIIGKTD